MRASLHSQGTLLFKSLDLSEMSVPSDTSNIAVSPTMSMTASIFTLVCISNILYMIYQSTDGLQQGRLAGFGAQIFPKMPHVHLLPQAQELTTSSSTGARGLGRSSRNHKARCAGGGRTPRAGGLGGTVGQTTTTLPTASSSTSTSGRAENTRDTISQQGYNTNSAWTDQNDDHRRGPHQDPPTCSDVDVHNTTPPSGTRWCARVSGRHYRELGVLNSVGTTKTKLWH